MKIICLLAAVMVAMVTPDALAQFQYSFEGSIVGGVTLSDYSGPGGDVLVPPTANFGPGGGPPTATVTGIGDGAFYDCATLTSVRIPESITNIGANAFSGCTSLTSVYFMGNAPAGDSTAFGGDSNVTAYYLPGTTGWGSAFDGLPAAPWLPSISYTTNAGAITITAYGGADGAVAIPSAINGLPVISIGELAFYGITSLTSLTIPDSVTSIEDHAFLLCVGLTNVTIPDSVTNLGEYTFSGCNSLKSVSIPASVNAIRDGTFQYCFSLASATIASGITNIGNGAFENCGLTNITIPGSVVSIGDATYSYFDNGDGAFFGCGSLSSVTIGNGVSNINQAFFGCLKLTSVYSAGDAPNADLFAFAGDTNATVYYLPGTTGWSSTFAGLPAVLWDPLIEAGGSSFGVSSNQFGFTVSGTSNLVVAVETANSPSALVWSPVQTVALTNGVAYFSEPLRTNAAGRFYRLGFP